MNDKVRKVFDLLGVELNEEFKIKGFNGDYLIDGKLKVMHRNSRMDNWRMSLYTIVDFLEGKVKIIKLPALTEADKNAVRYLRDGGMKYVARDGNGLLYAYESKPLKTGCGWRLENENIAPCRVFKNLFQFVKWEDEEPFCIEDLEV